jgi:hypothetical protein
LPASLIIHLKSCNKKYNIVTEEEKRIEYGETPPNEYINFNKIPIRNVRLPKQAIKMDPKISQGSFSRTRQVIKKVNLLQTHDASQSTATS